MELSILYNITIILFIAVIVLLLFDKLKISPVIALFVTGIILGQFISSATTISTISELGVIVLLFIIGLEFSVEKFAAIKNYAIIGGLLQVLITTGIVTVLGVLFGLPINQAIFIGFFVSFSSTAIVMKLLQEKKQTSSIQGRVILGILIFQDLAVILVLLLTPLLGGVSINMESLPIILSKLFIVSLVLIISGKWIIPKVLQIAAHTKNKDIFILSTLFICLGTTYATSVVGISPELGAFLAGLIISRTEFNHQTLGYVEPFQSVFLSLFLISIGLMLDLNFFIDNLLIILIMALLVLFIKILATGITIKILKLPMRIIITVAILLSQIGEFSFVLASKGLEYGLITNSMFSMCLAVTVITMSLTPFLQKAIPRIKRKTNDIGLFNSINENLPEIKTSSIEALEDHVIIVGFGINGKNMALAVKKYNIPYVVIDLNINLVKKEREKGKPIFYGDATQESVLKKVNITGAKVIVIATSDYRSTLKSVDAAKRLNPNIHTIVRTRYLRNVEKLYDMGADEVVPEEFETSIEIFTRIMEYYNKNEQEITKYINELRSDNYDTFRSISPDDLSTSLNDKLDNVNIDSITVLSDRLLKSLKFKEHNLTVTCVIRDDKTITKLFDNLLLKEKDKVIFAGKPEDVEEYINIRQARL